MEKVKEYLRIAIVIATILIMVSIFREIFHNVNNNADWKDEIFNLSINGKHYGEIDINEELLPQVNSGDRIKITKIFEGPECSERTLVFRTYSCSVEAFVAGKKVYEYGNGYFIENKTLGRGFHFVKLNELTPERRSVVIEMTAGEDMSYLWVDYFKTTAGNTIWTEILNRNIFAIYLSLLLLLIGMAGIVGAMLMYIVDKKSNLHLLYSFEAAFFVGLWNSCTYGLFQMMTGNYELTSFFEYASLYIAGFFYLSTIEVIKAGTKYSKIISYMKYCYFTFIVIVFSLNALKIYPITQTVMIYRNVAVFILLSIFLIVIRDYNTQKKFEKALSVSNIIAVVLIATHTILLNMNILFISIGENKVMLDNMLTSIAILIVFITPLFSYALKISEIGIYETQIGLLKNIAYKDQLTGLDNRYSGMAFVMELKKDEIPYHIIMYDLNNLKYVNDNFGHDRGDKLIIDFSNCLQKVFNTEDSINIRHGGDEFLTIAKSFDLQDINEHMTLLHKYIAEVNSLNHDNWLSVATGLASSEEVEDDSYDNVLKLADQRMYRQKVSMKTI